MKEAAVGDRKKKKKKREKERERDKCSLFAKLVEWEAANSLHEIVTKKIFQLCC